MARRAVVAIGGNSLIRDKRHQTIPDQFETTRTTAAHIANMVEDGWDVVITHGNGPQVGAILLRAELTRDILYEVPLDSCGAESGGLLGYMVQQQLRNEFVRRGIPKDVVTVITQSLVDADDPAFDHPSKPIGPHYSEEQARQYARERGWAVMEDAGRGWRRIVPSPTPREIIEAPAVETLLREGMVVIAAGGGGVPVVRDEQGILRGAAAVIDKDLASSLLAIRLQVDLFLISTDVSKVALNYGTPQQVDLDRMTVAEAEYYHAEGHFAPGSMGPKIQASVHFVKQTGKRAVITSPDHIGAALRGSCDTEIVP